LVGYLAIGTVACLVLFLALDTAWRSAVQLSDRRRQLAAWSALAAELGYHAGIDADRVVIRGSAASRPFEVDYRNGLGYGLDAMLGLRVALPDNRVRLLISADARNLEFPTGLAAERDVSRLTTGHAQFDAVFAVSGNAAGRAVLERAGESARAVLLEHPELSVFWRGTAPWIDLGSGELEAARLRAAHRLMGALLVAAEPALSSSATGVEKG
jgi:hypothetical protein